MFPASKIQKFQLKKKTLIYIYIYIAVESRDPLDPLRHRSALRKIAKDTFALTHEIVVA